MLSVQVAEISSLTVEIQHISQVDGIAHDPCRVHEVVGDLLTHQEDHLS